MRSIEDDYEALKGELPKTEYQTLDSDVMGELLRTFNAPALWKRTATCSGASTSTS